MRKQPFVLVAAFLSILVLGPYCVTATAQTAAAPANPADKMFVGTVARVKAAKANLEQVKRSTPNNSGAITGAEQGVTTEAANLVPYLFSVVGDAARPGFLSQMEEERLSKQVGTAANAAGSTSVVSQGSVPGLIGMAVENGALTRSISGTTITLRGSPANIYSALAKKAYLAAGPSIPPLDGSFEAIAKRASFSVSFDTSRGQPTATTTATSSSTSGSSKPLVFTGDRQQLAGWGARYDLINKRDPRRPEWQAAWDSLLNEKGLPFITSLTQVIQTILERPSTLESVKAFRQWQTTLGTAVLTATTDDQVLAALKSASATFKPIARDLIRDIPELDLQIRRAVSAASAFYGSRNDLIDGIMKSWTAAVEYNFVSQSNTNGTVTTASGQKVPLPDLGNLNIVVSKGFVDGPEFTLNAGATWFLAIPAGLNIGRVRDVRVSAELAFPLADIQQIGRPVLSFAGQFMSLREEALGQKITVNGVDVSTKGNLGLFQAKLKIPTKNSGVSVPISATWSNRTELIKEKDVRANIGVTFDLDKVFAKP